MREKYIIGKIWLVETLERESCGNKWNIAGREEKKKDEWLLVSGA